MEKLVFKGQISPLSFGQTSYNILKELYKKKVQCVFFPRQIDWNPFNPSEEFKNWVESSANSRFSKLHKSLKSLDLWHISGSEDRLTNHSSLFSFHETNQPTNEEVNLLNQKDNSFFSSNWTVDNFKTYGVENVSYAPLGFDEEFKVYDVKFDSKITHWGLVGKFEPNRKNTVLIIHAWLERYANNPKHQLSILIHNPFIPQDQMNGIYQQIFNRGKPHNVNILGPIKTNKEMNSLYNSFDIDLSGFSSSEGWGIPAFTATALGKWSIVTNVTAHKDWATKDNSILVEAMSLKPAPDGMFFHPNQPFNQGSFYNFTKEQLHKAMEQAESKAKTINTEGLKLQEKFTYSKTVDILLEKIYSK